MRKQEQLVAHFRTIFPHILNSKLVLFYAIIIPMDEITAVIEKISSTGAGIAHSNGAVIFTEGAIPQEKCKIRIIKRNKNYYMGKLIEIIEKSPYRITPFCPMYNICGSCNFQHINYEYQLKLKKQITEDALRGIDTVIFDTVPSPQIKEYRHKIQYPVRQTKVSKRIITGYFKPKTHDIVNIKYCPIQPHICDEIIAFIKAQAPKYKISGYDETLHKGLLRHIVMRVSAQTKTVLITFVINSEITPERLKEFAVFLYDSFPANISGVTVNHNTTKSNLIMTDKTALLIGKEYIPEELCGIDFKIESGTFFQVNPRSAENIFKFVKEFIKNNFTQPKLLDAYSGISAFGLVLSDVCKSVTSVEECEASVRLAQKVKELNKIKNIELIKDDFTKYSNKFRKENFKKFDITILDPPRKGCTKAGLDGCISLTKSKIIYISCNPSTLARDLKYLIKKGAIVEGVHPFDLFCHTYHIENAAIVDISKC